MDRPWMIAAFSGWGDAAEASSGAVQHLLDEWGADVVVELDAEDFYDFQVARPILHRFGDFDPDLEWPSALIYHGRPPRTERDVLLLLAPEPNLRWPTFCHQVLDTAVRAGVTDLVLLGSLLADSPHTRPVPVVGTTNDTSTLIPPRGQESNYSGPVGITTALMFEAAQVGLPAMSLWASVPHYLAEAPCPKASLALLGAVEDALGVTLPEGGLPELSEAWQRGAEHLYEHDEDVAEYVRSLEAEQEPEDLPQASGDAIAREFERYLRRRQGPGHGPPGL